MKTRELFGVYLDWAVGNCLSLELYSKKEYVHHDINLKLNHINSRGVFEEWSPSTNWYQAGDIISSEDISIIRVEDRLDTVLNKKIPLWAAMYGSLYPVDITEYISHEPLYQLYEADVIYGETPLIAAMRCYVDSMIGSEIDIPTELFNRDSVN